MTFYKHITQNTESLRLLFGKEEINIMKKQLRGVSLTQSEKNRLSQRIRPKLHAIQQCAVFKEEFSLKKGGDILKQLKILEEQMLLDKEGRNIKKIYIFGSFVKKEMTLDSDIDVAVEFQDITLKEASLFKKRILENAQDTFDISVFNTLPSHIQKEVIEHGKIIYKST